MTANSSTIYCPSALRARWPKGLAPIWRAMYPDVFDDDDLRITRKQPRNHFAEWFTAIHIYHRYGALSLIEKYRYRNHPRKAALIGKILSSKELQVLDDVSSDCATQAPDLLVYSPDSRDFWFAEAKGPRDRLSEEQQASHAAIRRRLKVRVAVFNVAVREPVSQPTIATTDARSAQLP